MSPDDLTLVKPAQSRRGKGESVVFKGSGKPWGRDGITVYVKRQSHYQRRAAWRLYRLTPMLRCEKRALEACKVLGVPVPDIVSYKEAGNDVELVLAEIENALPLSNAINTKGVQRELLIQNVGRVFAKLHKGGWVHGSLIDEHILVQMSDYSVHLIDLEKATFGVVRKKRDLARFFRQATYLSADEKQQLLDAYHAI